MIREVILAVALAAAGVQEPKVERPPSGRLLGDDAWLATALWPDAGPAVFRVPTPAELHDLELLVRTVLADAVDGRPLAKKDVEAAERLGFALGERKARGRRLRILVEQPSQRRGWGAYVVRVGPSGDRDWIVEAPHVFFDRHTGELATWLFLALGDDARALFVNTIGRHARAEGASPDDDRPADAAHGKAHPFSAATVAAATTLPRAEVLQLHGFGERGEESLGDPAIAMVVSAGTRDGSPLARRVASQLGTRFDGVRLFGTDANALGATTNVQQRLLRRLGRGEFVHLELSAATRRTLVHDDDARRHLLRALQSTTEAADSDAK